MKQKVFISGLCLTLALSLVACGGQQTGPEPQEPKQEVQQTEPVTTEPTVEPMEVKQEVKPVNPTAPVEEEQDTGDKSASVVVDGEAEPAVQLFTEVNEQVWATGNVNLRSGPSTEDAKVGSLNKGNSVTRIGVGTGDYSSWSKVKLSDGTEVYVASSYLTTTKPTTQSSSKPSGSTSSTQNQTQNQTQQPSKPSSGGKDIYGGFPTYKEYIDDICKQRPDKTRAEIEAAFPDLATGQVNSEAAAADAAVGRFNH